MNSSEIARSDNGRTAFRTTFTSMTRLKTTPRAISVALLVGLASTLAPTPAFAGAIVWKCLETATDGTCTRGGYYVNPAASGPLVCEPGFEGCSVLRNTSPANSPEYFGIKPGECVSKNANYPSKDGYDDDTDCNGFKDTDDRKHYVGDRVLELTGLVPGATVFGQLTVAGATSSGFVTAYACADGVPRAANGHVTKSDLNYNGPHQPVASNRLAVSADSAGKVCFYASTRVQIIVDLSAAATDQYRPFANRRTDTRVASGTPQRGPAADLKLNVPEAVGGKTVFGQLTVDNTTTGGFVTAYPCAAGIPRNAKNEISKSDLNYNGALHSVASNRLIVNADANGDICFHTSQRADLIVDLNATASSGVEPVQVARVDTRVDGQPAHHHASNEMRVNVPAAAGGKIVLGQLTVDKTTTGGFVTAYACAEGIPRNKKGDISKSDVNYDGRHDPVASNRLVVPADANGDICLYTQHGADFIIDINAVADTIRKATNFRYDSRTEN